MEAINEQDCAVIELGIETVDITPRIGSTLCGFAARANKPSTGIDAPLKARVIAIREGEKPYFLINFDLLGIGQSLEAQIVAALEDTLDDGFAAERSVFVATHTHSGPPTVAMTGEAAPDPAYWEQLSSQTAQAAKAALESAKPVSLYMASLTIPGLTYNRRAVLTDGRVSIVPEPELPVVERGPLDDELTTLLWRDVDGKNVAAIVHFPCHGVAVLTQSIHGDIPGEVCRRVGELLNVPCLYLQGATGDINPTALVAGRAELMEWMDRFMVHLNGLEDKFQEVNQEPFCVSSMHLPLEFGPLPGEKETERRIANLEKIGRGDTTSPEVQDTMPFVRELMHAKPGEPLDPVVTEYLAQALKESEIRALAAIKAGGTPSPYPLRLSLWRLGDLALAFIAAEVFAITGLRIKALREDTPILPVSYLTPLMGYLPDADAMTKGGYEVDYAWRFYGHVAPFATNSEQRVIEAVDEMLSNLIGVEER
jgi:neutral ceramidase